MAGFLVPNSADTNGAYAQAEPDAVDWLVAANQKSGVLLGCEFSVTGGNFNVLSTQNVVVNGDSIQSFSNTSVGLQGGGSDDRFDLVVWNGTDLALIVGTVSSDPVFPALPDGAVLIAAVHVPAGTANVALTIANTVDKRKFLLDGARGSADTTEVFLRNVGPDGVVTFTVFGDGKIEWGASGGPNVYHSGTDLIIDAATSTFQGAIEAGSASISGSVTATGLVTGSNIVRGNGSPSGSAPDGTIYQRTDEGAVYVYNSAINGGSGGWQLIEADEYPIGTVITSFRDDLSVGDPTWAKLDGSTITDFREGFFDMAASLPNVFTVSGTYGDDAQVELPNMADYFIAGAGPGQIGTEGGENQKTLDVSEIPSHKHFSSSATSTGGAHTHTATITAAGSHTHVTSGSGAHTHPITDPGHRHNGMNPYGNDTPTYFCGAVWGGNNKLDAHFSDASHTWTVDMSISTVKAYTGITIPSSGSHSHQISSAGQHTHPISVAADGSGHTHSLPTESLIGGSQPFDNRPQFMRLNYYVKV